MEQQANSALYASTDNPIYGSNLKLTATKHLSPYENFSYALKSKEVKRQYPSLLNRLSNFLDLQGTVEDKCNQLVKFAKEDPDLFQSNLMRYCNFQKQRIEKGEITEGTMRNYIKAIKLFCEMNEIHIFCERHYVYFLPKHAYRNLY